MNKKTVKAINKVVKEDGYVTPKTIKPKFKQKLRVWLLNSLYYIKLRKNRLYFRKPQANSDKFWARKMKKDLKEEKRLKSQGFIRPVKTKKPFYLAERHVKVSQHLTRKHADKNCPSCMGSGYVKNTIKTTMIICDCVDKIAGKKDWLEYCNKFEDLKKESIG